MKGSWSKGGTSGSSDGPPTESNRLLTGGSGCFYCSLETEGAHPTCDRPGCENQTHGGGPDGKRVLSYCPSCRENALVADGGLDAETVLGTVDPGDVVEVAGSPYRVVDVQDDEDDGVLRLYDLVERSETVKAAGGGDVDVYLHRSESDAIQTRVDQERERRDVQEDDVDEGDGVETDGGSEFADRVDEMFDEIEEEIDDSTPAEAMLYARCSAAFEDAVNNTPIPEENALGVMTAALFEAADTVGYARSDVIETAREHYIDEGGDA